MENKIIELAEKDFLKKVSKDDSIISELSAGAHPSWCPSCILGNDGNWCTLTVECMPTCN